MLFPAAAAAAATEAATAGGEKKTLNRLLLVMQLLLDLISLTLQFVDICSTDDEDTDAERTGGDGARKRISAVPAPFPHPGDGKIGVFLTGPGKNGLAVDVNE